jgi:hypothetical protein
VTREEAIEKLRGCAIFAEEDPATAHEDGDDILIQYLRSIGETEIAELWEQIRPKWYT